MQQFSSQLSTQPPRPFFPLFVLRSALYLVYFFVAAAAATPAALCHKAVIKFGCTKEGERGEGVQRRAGKVSQRVSEGEACVFQQE